VSIEAISRKVRGWRGTLLVVLVVGAPPLATQLLVPSWRGDVRAAVALAAGASGAALLLGAAAGRLRVSVRERQRVIAELEGQLEQCEAESRTGRDRMHEIRAVIASISAANRLVRHGTAIESHRRAELDRMLDSEIGRLERLVERREPSSRTTVVRLDDVVLPLVVAHRARGREVRWRPTGVRVLAAHDDLAEALSILLENAARHAPSSPVTIDVCCGMGRARISVSDRGPGVPPRLRRTLFDRDVRGPDSPGDGIGLDIAQRLVTAHRGKLRLADTNARTGARFVIDLAAIHDTARDRHDAVAHSA
jgi:signal transduction histidine kinase